MGYQTPLTRRLGLEHPIIQAPMAGGPTTVELVAATSTAGALGSFGAAYTPPEQILELARQTRGQTEKPFALNLFAPTTTPPDSDPGPIIEALSAYFEELGLPAPVPPSRQGDDFESQLQAVLEASPKVFSFTFGTVPPHAMEELKSREIFVIGTATTVDEAVTLEATGVDAVVAQGSEAGGHRGTFGVPFENALVGTIALVPQVVDAVKIPVIASGGIMDGRGVAAALALGAQAVQMGTAFLTCFEAGTSEPHRKALLSASEDSTRLTRAFSGRPARAIRNRFTESLDTPATEERILPFPLQNALTRPLRKAAGQQGRAEYISLWAGQGVRMVRQQGAAQLVATTAAQLEESFRGFSTSG